LLTPLKKTITTLWCSCLNSLYRATLTWLLSGSLFPCITSPSVGIPGLFLGSSGVARRAKRGRKRVLEDRKNSSQKRLTNRKGYAILQSLKRTPVEPTGERKRFRCECYGTHQVRTLTTQEWKAEQQLRDFSRNNARCLQFLSILRTSQATKLWPGSQLTTMHTNHFSDDEQWQIYTWMASLILAQDKRWRRA
jgi:hypothetical protein